MRDGDIDKAIRRAIGGDQRARHWLITSADTDDEPSAHVMVALLDGDSARLARALVRTTSRRDRQVIEIARACLAGDHDRVDALARDHLADYPDDLIVAWIAGGAARPAAGESRAPDS